MNQIKKICVIGSGVMGAGIVAQIANSQTPVVLLDIIPGAAANAKDKMLLGKIPQIAHPALLEYIIIGNLDEDLELIRSCDWVIEVIVEKLEIKAALYNKIFPYMKKGAILTSNTSTLPMGELRESITYPTDHFLLTHFFNPPRQMPLVELVYDDKTSKDSVKIITDFITHSLGKTIVRSNDTPGFIANRIGCFLMELCLKEAYEKKLSIQYIDHYFTQNLGLPSTGIFGLFDLIGLDVMQMISGVLLASLPKEDEFCQIYKKYDWYDKMLADGYKGRKGLGGFYRMRDIDGVKVKEVLDFKRLEYRDAQEFAELSSAPRDDDMASIIQQFFDYVNSLLGVVSNSKEDIDNAMKLGYSWKKGPFEMMLSKDSSSSAQKTTGNDDVLLRNQSAYLYEVRSKILVFTIKTKMNTLDENVFNLLIEAVDYAEKHDAEKLIIYNEGRYFSAGGNLKLFLEMGDKGDLDSADQFLELGQRAMMRVKYSKVPVIACAKGVALGGGCELLLHTHKIFAHLDLSAGLVEVGIGLIPAWGGCKEMILRANGDKAQIIKNLRNVIMQNRSSSAYGFFDYYMIENAEVVMNESDLLERAIDCDLDSLTILNQQSDRNGDLHKIDLVSSCVDSKLDNHTIFILKTLQDAVNSFTLSEKRILEIEKTIFKKLLVMPETLNKIRSVV